MQSITWTALFSPAPCLQTTEEQERFFRWNIWSLLKGRKFIAAERLHLWAQGIAAVFASPRDNCHGTRGCAAVWWGSSCGWGHGCPPQQCTSNLWIKSPGVTSTAGSPSEGNSRNVPWRAKESQSGGCRSEGLSREHIYDGKTSKKIIGRRRCSCQDQYFTTVYLIDLTTWLKKGNKCWFTPQVQRHLFHGDVVSLVFQIPPLLYPASGQYGRTEESGKKKGGGDCALCQWECGVTRDVTTKQPFCSRYWTVMCGDASLRPT